MAARAASRYARSSFPPRLEYSSLAVAAFKCHVPWRIHLFHRGRDKKAFSWETCRGQRLLLKPWQPWKLVKQSRVKYNSKRCRFTRFMRNRESWTCLLTPPPPRWLARIENSGKNSNRGNSGGGGEWYFNPVTSGRKISRSEGGGGGITRVNSAPNFWYPFFDTSHLITVISLSRGSPSLSFSGCARFTLVKPR